MSVKNDTMTTWRREDGEPIWGEFGWVTDEEFFTEDVSGEHVVAIKETWQKVASEMVVYNAPEPDEDDE